MPNNNNQKVFDITISTKKPKLIPTPSKQIKGNPRTSKENKTHVEPKLTSNETCSGKS